MTPFLNHHILSIFSKGNLEEKNVRLAKFYLQSSNLKLFKNLSRFACINDELVDKSVIYYCEECYKNLHYKFIILFIIYN